MSNQPYAPDTFTLAELRAMPVPDFVQRDPDALKAFYVGKFEALTKRKLYPAQTEMFVIELMSYVHSVFGEAAQAAFLQNRAIWAERGHLDDVGANVSTFRLKAQAAVAEVRFRLSVARNVSTTIPAGTRVAAGQVLVFATVSELVIPADADEGIVQIKAEKPGQAYNGFQPGQINTLLDPVAYVTSVANTTVSAGGSDAELDDRFRERIVNAFERITKAGSREGYRELVKSVHPDIVDVDVIRPKPGYIEITPLMLNGTSHDAIDAAIIARLDPETDVPMGDYPTIVKASGRVFNIVLTIRVDPSRTAGVQQRVEEAVRALFRRAEKDRQGRTVKHVGWSMELGAQVSPSALLSAVQNVPGVVHVDGPGFGYTDLKATQFAQVGQLTVTLVEAPNV